MATKKATSKPSTRATAKKATPAKITKPKSDKELVKEKFPKATLVIFKGKYHIVDSDQPLHSGLANSESDAWLLAAHGIA